MLDELNTTSLAVMGVACLASSFTVFWLFQKHIDGKRLLPYEPRIRVPWGGVVAMFAILMPVANLAHTLWKMDFESGDLAPVEIEQMESEPEPVPPRGVEDRPDEEADEPDETTVEFSSGRFIVDALLSTVVMLMFVMAVMGFLEWYHRADAHDLGLPTSYEQFLRDCGIGLIAALAAIAPMYVIQITLTFFFQPETQHPLIEDILENYTPGMLIAGLLTAVVAAPVFEEFAFRLVLQGWLEKVEDRRVGHHATERPTVVKLEILPSDDQPESLADEPDAADEPQVLTAFKLPDTPQEPAAVPMPSRGMFDILPYGWLPIVVTGTLFGAAHLGQGVAPIPLVLFGMVLGYLYQRTHRLAPCIVAHATFNAFSLTMLWLSVR